MSNNAIYIQYGDTIINQKILSDNKKYAAVSVLVHVYKIAEKVTLKPCKTFMLN